MLFFDSVAAEEEASCLYLERKICFEEMILFSLESSACLYPPVMNSLQCPLQSPQASCDSAELSCAELYGGLFYCRCWVAEISELGDFFGRQEKK